MVNNSKRGTRLDEVPVQGVLEFSTAFNRYDV